VFNIHDLLKRFPAGKLDHILIASGANRAIAQSLDKLGITGYSIVTVPSYLMENLLPTPLTERLAAQAIRIRSRFYKRTTHLFFGEHGGKFIGNNKYYYLYLREKTELPLYWVVDDTELYNDLKEQGIFVLHLNTPNIEEYLYRAACFYFDNMTWQRKYPLLRNYGARIIHMSHGVGLKLTEKMLIPEEFMKKLTPGEEKQLNSKIFQNDLLVSTSEFYARNVSAPAYNTPPERIVCSGYPKNDLFYRHIRGSNIFTDKETDARLDELKKNGRKIIVYAPTFRDMDREFKYAGIIDYKNLNRYLAANGMVLVIKGHTSAVAEIKIEDREKLSHIVFYSSGRDGYPMLKKADLLITDYSSIYMDFLHSGKPVIFFTYDYDEYVKNHREIQFDYQTM
ncbi:MAG: hypothetical protein GY757_47870, partial [bacterium]|nr:hypothetical protein [bacterium]